MQIVTPDPCLIMQPHYFSDKFFLDMAMSIMKKLSVFSMFSLSKPLLQSRNFRPAIRKKEGYRKKKQVDCHVHFCRFYSSFFVPLTNSLVVSKR